MDKRVPSTTRIGRLAKRLRANTEIGSYLARFNWPVAHRECVRALDCIGLIPERAGWTDRDSAFLTIVILFWHEYDLSTRAAAAMLLNQLTGIRIDAVLATERVLRDAWDGASGQTRLFSEEP